MIRRITVAVLCFSLFILGSFSVSAEGNTGMKEIEGEPKYESFTYIDAGEDKTVNVASPTAYAPAYVVDTATLGTQLTEPVDLFAYQDELYVVDRSGNAVFILDSECRLIKRIEQFNWNDQTETFNLPEGVCVQNQKIYIADTGNHRIVILNLDGSCSTVITAPESELLSESLSFEPQKIAVDEHGRIYSVVKGVYEGIMQIYENGKFAGFIGSIPVTVDPVTRLWKSIMSQEARNKLQSFIPVEYTNLTLDSSGFLMTTSLADDNLQSIRRINSAGDDILIRDPLGDFHVNGVETGGDSTILPSVFVDVATESDNRYFALDKQYGRIFAYDEVGNLLYTFGGSYTGQIGTFQNASALTLLRGMLFVADRESGAITVFKQTEYAAIIQEAFSLYNQDLYEESIDAFRQILDKNPYYFIAYNQIGKAFYRLDKYEEAIKYYKIAGNQEGYSEAYSCIRKEKLTDNFGWFIFGTILVICLFAALIKFVRRQLKKRPPKKGGILDSLGYVFYVLRHPMDGFWDLKHENRGKAWVSTLLIALTVVSFAVERGLTAFNIATEPFGKLDWTHELKVVLLPLIIILVANVSVTSLMEGKGTFKQLYIAAGYTLTPFILVKIPITVISGLLTQNELLYVSLISVIATIYVLALVLVAISATHEYTTGKTVGVAALTLAAAVIICFICALFFALFSQIVGFLYTVLEEIRYR